MKAEVWQMGKQDSLVAFFHRRLTRAARRIHPQPQEETCHYLVQMLEHFSQSDRLFEYHEGQLGLRPLALLYGDAHEAGSEHERCLLLQRLGDLSLFLAALFPENFTRRGLRRDYLVGMGGGAYNYLSERAPNRRHVFKELTGRFVQMTELVARTCFRRGEGMTADEVLRLYERWRRTGDPGLAEQLQAQGIKLPGGAS